MFFKNQFIHHLLPSFYLWMDYQLTAKGEAFLKKTLEFHKYNDPQLRSKHVYGSPYAQFVYDSSVGPIPDKVKANGVDVVRGEGGLSIDFQNGRIISDQSLSNVTGEFLVKTFNVYVADEDEEVFVERALSSARDRFEKKNLYAAPNTYNAPCIIISHSRMQNSPFAFSGEDVTENAFRAIVVADSKFLAEAAISFFADRARICFPLITDMSDIPFNHLGDLKSEAFNYPDLFPKYKTKVFIANTYASRVVRREGEKFSFFTGVVEFDLETVRLPRQEAF